MKKNLAAFSSVGGAERIVRGLFSEEPLPILAVCGACGRIKNRRGAWTRWMTNLDAAQKKICPECEKYKFLVH